MSIDTAVRVPGWHVGHWTHPRNETGCSVLIPERSAIAVADVRGGAPGTREIALLESGRLVQRVDAVLLTGGSAFGLAAADGVSAWLRERGRGFPTSSMAVPIVSAAVLFDLRGEQPSWPDASAGYEASSNAHSGGWICGPVGAGSGATVGKVLGHKRSSRGGVGAAQVNTSAGSVTALVAVNAFGDIVDPTVGTILAGARSEEPGRDWLDCEQHILNHGLHAVEPGTNTTLGAVVVDATVDHDALVRMAIAAHDGLARTIRPSHTLLDGDTIFALSLREGTPEPSAVMQLSAGAHRATMEAIIASVTAS